MGDFNCIRRKEDRVNCVYNNRDSVKFNGFMEEMGLIELVGVNFSFTWFGPGDKKSRLDRVLVNVEWLTSHSWIISAGHKRNSDHIPLIMSSDYNDWVPKPFKAFDNWLQLEEVQQLMHDIVLNNNNKSWNGVMKELKLGLKSWKNSKGVSHENLIKSLKDKLQKLDQAVGNSEEKAMVFENLQHAY